MAAVKKTCFCPCYELLPFWNFFILPLKGLHPKIDGMINLLFFKAFARKNIKIIIYSRDLKLQCREIFYLHVFSSFNRKNVKISPQNLLLLTSLPPLLHSLKKHFPIFPFCNEENARDESDRERKKSRRNLKPAGKNH